MKNSMLKQSRARVWGCGVLAGLAAFVLWVLPCSAAHKQVAEIQAFAVGGDMGEWAATPSGNIRVTGMGEVLMFLSSDPLFTGRFTWVGNANANADLDGLANCKNTFEVGTWDQDPISGEWVFTPSPAGGLFLGTAQATGNLFGPFEIKGEAHGVAGELKGLTLHIRGEGADLYVQHYTVEYLDPAREE